MTSSRRGRMVWPLRHDDVSRTVGRSRDRDAPAEPPLRRALALGVGLQLLQQLVGINTVMYYSTTILEASHDDVSQQDCLPSQLESNCHVLLDDNSSRTLASPRARPRGSRCSAPRRRASASRSRSRSRCPTRSAGAHRCCSRARARSSRSPRSRSASRSPRPVGSSARGTCRRAPARPSPSAHSSRASRAARAAFPSSAFRLPSSVFRLPSSFSLLPSSFSLLPSPFVLRPSSFVLLPSFSFRPHDQRAHATGKPPSSFLRFFLPDHAGE